MYRVCLYIVPETEEIEIEEDTEEDTESEESSNSATPWWMKDRNYNRVINCKRHSRLIRSSSKTQDLIFNMKNLATEDDDQQVSRI